MEKLKDIVETPEETPKRLPARDRIGQRIEAGKLERERRRKLYGDPLERLAKILADLPPEVLAENFGRDEDGQFYVKRHQD